LCITSTVKAKTLAN